MMRPAIRPGSHPVETTLYTIESPAIAEMYGHVANWLKRKVTGGLIYGSNRYGKSEAINYITKNIKKTDSYKNLPIVSISAIDSSRSTDSSFWSHFLYCANYELLQTGNSENKRQRFINYLRVLAYKNKNKSILIFIDEAQQLSQQQYQYLVDVQNILNRYGVFACFVMVGQPELMALTEMFQISGKMQIVSRFMARQNEFHGLRNVDDFAYCLNVYDEIVQYPADSGWTFTRYFAPEAYEMGWRLTNESGLLWKAFSEIRSLDKLPVKHEVPIEYFVRTVEYLLTDEAKTGVTFQGFNYNQCKKAILFTGYAEGSKYIVNM